MNPDSRQDIYERDHYTCQYCGWCGATSFEQWQLGWFAIDHIVPQAHGGTDDPSNLVVACHRCNSMKGQEKCSSVEEGRRIIAKKRAEREVWFRHFVLKV